MKILKAKIQNFLTIGEAELELDDRGLLLIVGDNADDSSANSNGAGKSSLVDAICWALYGTTARGISGDDVVNESAKKNCRVSLLVQDGDDQYMIQRHRKHKENKNALIVSIQESETLFKDISKGTDKETQEIVNGIIGCSEEVFTSAVYAGQERMPDLPAMTDKSLKVLIEEAAGIEVLEEAHSIARKRLLEAKDKANTELAKISTLDSAIASYRETEASLAEASKGFEEGKRDRAKAHLATAEPHFNLLKTLTKHDLEKVKVVIAEMKAKLVTFDVIENELGDIAKRLTAARETKVRVSTLYNAAADRVKKQIAEAKNVEALKGTPCKECGKEYCADDLHDAIKARQNTIDEGKKTLLKLRDEHGEAKNLVDSLEAEYEKVKEKLKDKVDLQDKIRRFESQLRDMTVENDSLERAAAAIERIKAEAKAMMTQENPFTAKIEEAKTKREGYEKSKTIQETIVQKATDHVALCEDAVKVFGPAGVRAHILDTVTPFLNSRTNDYLGALSDGNVHATWTTLSTTAKGEAKEKFSIAVANDKGGSSFKKLSGGEKRKVRLATALALQDLVASRATKPVQLFIADEIDYALDDSGLERLMVLLERKARERGTVLIISHQSGLRDWCDQVITVTKSGGQSAVNGDNLKTAA